MVSTNSIRSSRRFRSTTRSESINDAWERGSSFAATIRQYHRATKIWPSARRRRSLTQQRSSLPFRSSLKRKFRTAPDWAAEVATPLPCCLRNFLFKLDRKGRLRSEEHTSELQSRRDLVCRLLLE